MSRFIFLKPIEPDRMALLFKEKVKQYNGILDEEIMITFLSTLFYTPSGRELRTIKARWNYDKYIGDTSNDLIMTINGKYYLVSKENERKFLYKLDIDLFTAAKKRAIARRKRGLVDQITLDLETFITNFKEVE